MSILFLYSGLFVKKIENEDDNEYDIKQYSEIFKKTYDFVVENFYVLCEIKEQSDHYWRV